MDYLIENDRPETAFRMVPAALIEDAALSADARMALIWMCSKPRGYLLRLSELRSALRFGDFVWRRVSGELRERGALVQVEHRCQRTGRLLGTVVRVTWAPWLTEALETNVSVRGRRQPVGKSRDRGVGNQRLGVGNQRDPRGKPTPLIREREGARSRSEGERAPSPALSPERSREAAPGRSSGGVPPVERRRELVADAMLELFGNPASAGSDVGAAGKPSDCLEREQAERLARHRRSDALSGSVAAATSSRVPKG